MESSSSDFDSNGGVSVRPEVQTAEMASAFGVDLPKNPFEDNSSESAEPSEEGPPLVFPAGSSSKYSDSENSDSEHSDSDDDADDEDSGDNSEASEYWVYWNERWLCLGQIIEEDSDSDDNSDDSDEDSDDSDDDSDDSDDSDDDSEASEIWVRWNEHWHCLGQTNECQGLVIETGSDSEEDSNECSEEKFHDCPPNSPVSTPCVNHEDELNMREDALPEFARSTPDSDISQVEDSNIRRGA